MNAKLKRFLINWWVWLDEGANTFRGGSPNETVSSVAGKARAAGKRWGCVLCGVLDWLQPNHCASAMLVKVGDDAVVPDDVAPSQDAGDRV